MSACRNSCRKEPVKVRSANSYGVGLKTKGGLAFEDSIVLLAAIKVRVLIIIIVTKLMPSGPDRLLQNRSSEMFFLLHFCVVAQLAFLASQN